MSTGDWQLMQRALRLAARGWGQVQPNPLVGALVVRDGRVLAEGWHAVLGGPHAEVVALRAAAGAAQGATLYVTLEPCAHTGRTPPCTEAIIAAGIKRVVIATRDPNPLAGGGAERLRQAGIEVEEDVAAAEARRLNAAFFHWYERGEPWVALKLAVSIDGAIGSLAGPRLLITGASARAEANRLRAGFDALLVGSRTALRDDPLLTVRDHPVRVPPARVVLDSNARLSPDAALLRTAAAAPVLVCVAPDAPAHRVAALGKAGAEVLTIARAAGGGLDLDAVLRALAGRDCRAVLCEGGGQLARALLAADRVERWYLFLAPRVLGPETVRALEPGPGARPGGWLITSHEAVGEDLEIVLERDRSKG